MTPEPGDAAARARALDVTTSFVVQAPAGSGKTTLLTQRLLALLVTVEQPEQVVAITFTRKAAEEMRVRILRALELGRGAAPADPFQLTTWRLARAVLVRDAERDWQLALQPGRLRLMTIDALCQHLVRQLPLTAGLAGPRVVEENAAGLYAQAARAALAALGEGDEWRAPLARALTHVDNDWDTLESLVADMLGRRDQWLRSLAGRAEAARLEAAHRDLVAALLARLRDALPPDSHAALVEVARYAARHLGDDAGALAHFVEATALPPATLAGLPAWQALIGLLLTQGNTPRRSLDRRVGFPAGKGEAAEAKARALELIGRLGEQPRLLVQLRRVRCLPALPYGAGEWDVVLALLRLLVRATAELVSAGNVSGRVDFVSFALAALDALGPPEQPSDLALVLDHRIQHLLIDEFQDTSRTQYELVLRLTAGWTSGDGRTLFLVGDPMQSIYRFRQADVSLFTRLLGERRLGMVALETLALTVNFRAQAGLVNWINARMPGALATVEAFDLPFVAQHAARAAAPAAVSVELTLGHDVLGEAQAVAARVADIRAREPGASIAVLVRARSHLGRIGACLLARGIPFAARDIEPLATVPAVADLVALTRALLHPADRLAWLAVLRAPWCGLRLASLDRLAGAAGTVAEALFDPACLDALPAPERSRAVNVAAALAWARGAAADLPLAARVEGAWLRLGGPATLAEAAAADDVRAYFSVLEAVAAEAEPLTVGRLAARLAGHFANPPAVAGAGAVQIMTMHKAKGLEFDHVLLPGLGRAPRADGRALLLWREENLARGTALLLAPLPGKGDSPLYEFLRAENKRDAQAEAARLLYVAVTRARDHLHLFGHLRPPRSEGGSAPRPDGGSLLDMLWDGLGIEATTVPAVTPSLAQRADGRLRRFAAAVAPPPVVPVMAAELPDVAFDWAGTTARFVGTVTHRLLQLLRTADAADAAWLARARHFAQAELRAHGIGGSELGDAVGQVLEALRGTLASERGRWLLAAHRELEVEWRLAEAGAVGVQHRVIDRSFVDEDGCRWIIDFKTGSHAGGGREAWLDQEQARYRAQLERYAAAVARFERRPIRLGLYFPLLDGWRTWPYQP